MEIRAEEMLKENLLFKSKNEPKINALAEKELKYIMKEISYKKGTKFTGIHYLVDCAYELEDLRSVTNIIKNKLKSLGYGAESNIHDFNLLIITWNNDGKNAIFESGKWHHDYCD
jgi:hypothetical protein